MTGVIKGTGASVPSRILENKELENLVETSDAWIQERTGIERRHIAVRETTVSMAAEAAAEALKEAEGNKESDDGTKKVLSLVTGKLAYPYILSMAERMEKAFGFLRINVFGIINDFFGERITVSGLLTGQDIEKQLKGKELGERILLPENVLRSGERVFLDDMTVEELEKALQVRVDIVKSSGRDFVNAILGNS